MPSKVMMPILSDDQWSTDTITVLDTIFAHFLVSDFSQTYMYTNSVSSLPYLIQKYTNIEELKREIDVTLNRYVTRYFDEVDIHVDIIDTPNTDKNYLTLTIDISVVDGTNTINLSRILEIENSKISTVSKNQ